LPFSNTLKEKEQGELADLLRLINDRHYDLYKALWKFYSFACFFDVSLETGYQEVETALNSVELSLLQLRTAMADYLASHAG